MRAYYLDTAKDGKDIIRVDLPDPTPKPGEVVVRVRAASLNFRDLLISAGRYSTSIPSPLIPLSDGAGEVAAIGEGVTGVKVGDRVMGAFYPYWVSGPISAVNRARGLGGNINGALAEYMVLPASAAVPMPNHMSFEEAATLPCAAVTAWNALFDIARIKPGNTVLLQGSGGVSIFAFQMAKMAGARVIHLSGSAAKCERLKGMGADHVVNYGETPEWHKTALDLTDGVGVDCIVEVGGPGTLERSFNAIRVGGTIVSIGFVSQGGDVNPRQVISRAIRLEGISVGSVDSAREMVSALNLSGLKPVVDTVFPFEEAQAGYDAIRAAGHFGKLVISI